MLFTRSGLTCKSFKITTAPIIKPWYEFVTRCVHNSEQSQKKPMQNRPLRVLGIESSCDETAAAIVDSNGYILHESMVSQWPLHQVQGGIVPTVAVREHTRYIDEVVNRAIKGSGLALPTVPVLYPTARTSPLLDADLEEIKALPRNEDEDIGIDAIAVTAGPGLAPCLEVGLSKAKQLARLWNLPLLAVNHIEAHSLVASLAHKLNNGIPEVSFPYLALVVSGGHSQLSWVKGLGDSVVLGSTLDDAVGEAFDKACYLIGAYSLDLESMRKLCEKERVERGLEPFKSIYEIGDKKDTESMHDMNSPVSPGSAEAISPRTLTSLSEIPRRDVEFLSNMQSIMAKQETSATTADVVSHEWDKGLCSAPKHDILQAQKTLVKTKTGKAPLPAGAVIEEAARIYDNILSILERSTPHLVKPRSESTLVFGTPRVLGLDAPHLGHPLLPVTPLPQPLREPNSQPYASFSFSGVKSALRRLVEAHLNSKKRSSSDLNDSSQIQLDNLSKLSIANAFQRTVNAHIVQRVQRAVAHVQVSFMHDLDNKIRIPIVISGGVAANQLLKEAIERGLHCQCNHEITNFSGSSKSIVVVPPRKLCTDNGVMIAWAGVQRLSQNPCTKGDSLWTGFQPRWPIGPSFEIPRPRSQNQIKKMERAKRKDLSSSKCSDL